jgi:hypothetical protein
MAPITADGTGGTLSRRATTIAADPAKAAVA